MSQRRSKRLLLGSMVLVILFFVSLALGFTSKPAQSSSASFTKTDQVMADNQVKLCSDYAKLCFDRPASWTRSHILHVAGSSNDAVEVNPPTGTVLEFAKFSRATADDCDAAKASACFIVTHDVDQLSNGLTLLLATLTYTPPTCSDMCGQPSYQPFIRLMPSADIAKLGLRAGVATNYTSFNPSVRFTGGSPVVLQVLPGKLSSQESADRWLTSDEAKTAARIMGSVRGE